MKKILVILLSLSTPSWSAVAFLNTNTMTDVSGGSFSASLSVTNSGSNRAAFACVSTDGSAVGAISATYGGQTMTSAGAKSRNTSANSYTEVFYLVNPPTGSNTLAVTVSGTVTEIYANLVAFTGVDQTTPVRAGSYQATSGNTGAGGTFSLTVTGSSTDDLTMTCVNGGSSPLNVTNQTLDGLDVGGALQGEHDHATTGASSVTHTWTPSANDEVAIVGLSIMASGSTSATKGTITSRVGTGVVSTKAGTGSMTIR